MTTNDDRLLPACNQTWDVLTDDGFPEDRPPENVTNGAVGTLPHLLQLELFNSGLVRCDGRTLDANVVLSNRFGTFHSHCREL